MKKDWNRMRHVLGQASNALKKTPKNHDKRKKRTKFKSRCDMSSEKDLVLFVVVLRLGIQSPPPPTQLPLAPKSFHISDFS
jgi:hypothetical protein